MTQQDLKACNSTAHGCGKTEFDETTEEDSEVLDPVIRHQRLYPHLH